MQITLGQQYNVGEKPTVILSIYINRHAGTPEKLVIYITKAINTKPLVEARSVNVKKTTTFSPDSRMLRRSRRVQIFS